MAACGMSRRAFVVGGVALAASAAVGAGVGIGAKAAQADVLRPPGSLPEDEFMARCIKCERCISVCPENVLRPMGIEGGFLRARTPELTYASGSCTFCDKCREVCPTAAIGSMDAETPEVGWIGIAVLHEDRCLAFPETGSCGICVDACPYEALSFDEKRQPVVDVSKCNGCGECVRICPANKLTSFSGGTTRGIEVVTKKAYSAMGGA